MLPVEDLDCLQYDYDEELIEHIRPNLEIAIMVSNVLSILLDLAVYKWRHLACIILYFECIVSLSEGLIPVLTWNSITSL